MCGIKRYSSVSSGKDNERKRNWACRIAILSFIVGNLAKCSITLVMFF
jgi:type IV secretory pathway component VirB8